jgi:hypothetical protein
VAGEVGLVGEADLDRDLVAGLGDEALWNPEDWKSEVVIGCS